MVRLRFYHSTPLCDPVIWSYNWVQIPKDIIKFFIPGTSLSLQPSTRRRSGWWPTPGSSSCTRTLTLEASKPFPARKKSLRLKWNFFTITRNKPVFVQRQATSRFIFVRLLIEEPWSSGLSRCLWSKLFGCFLHFPKYIFLYLGIRR